MSENLQARLGAKIKQARIEAGMSLRRLAGLASSSHPALAEWERGEGRLSVEVLFRIAQALQKPLSYFLGDLEEELLKAKSLDRSILQVEDIQDPIAGEVEALMLLQAAVRARYSKQFSEAAAYAAQAKAVWEGLGERAKSAMALVALGDIAWFQDDWGGAEEHYGQAVAIMEGLAPHKDDADALRYAQALWAYSRVPAREGRYQEALDLLARSRKAAPGNTFALAICTQLAGRIYLEQEETARAAQSFNEALIHSRRANHPHSEADSLVGLARAKLLSGQHDEAARYLDEAETIARTEEFDDVLTEIERIRDRNHAE